MESSDARILRGAAIPTGLVGVIAIVISLLTTGSKGALGAVIGVAVVIVFFTISVLVVNYTAKISPQTMMTAGLMSYAVKFLAVLGLVIALKNVTFWNPRAFAWTVVVLTLVWIMAETRALLQTRVIELAPGKEIAKSADDRADQSS
jgi:ATP synthase protein I